MTRIPYAEMLEVFTRVLLTCGFRKDRAELCARLFADASRDGVYTHGLNRFPGFVDFARKGIVNVHAEPELVERFGALERWDGRSGPGPLNAWFSMDRAIALARESGLGCVALRNTNHWMRAGNYGWQAADAGCIGICWTNTVALAPPWGAGTPRLGNNPLVIAVPRADGHVVLDMAMTQFSHGKLNVYRTRGELLPVDGGYDSEGRMTRDPGAILDARRPLPIGYWKGSGLAMMLDLVASLLSAGQATHQISKSEIETRVSQVFMAFDLRRLGSEALAAQLVNEIVDNVHSAAPLEEEGRVTYPGERTLALRKENLELGVPVEPALWQTIKQLAQEGDRVYNEELCLTRIPGECVRSGPGTRARPRSGMNPRLKRLLSRLADTFDPKREREIMNRHWGALSYKPLERLPLITMYPLPSDSPWQPFPHGEVFDDPEKMLFNELVSAWDTHLVYREQVGDDLPATIRPNFGTVLVASVFGARIEQRGDDPPWAMPFASREECDAALSRGPVGLDDGWLPRVVERYRTYRDLLSAYSPLPHFLKMTLPDLQGPLDTLEMLRGSELYAELALEPELTDRWLGAVAAAQVAIARALQPLLTDVLVNCIHQHGFMVAGQILIRNDSALMLSPDMYRERVAPHDELVLRELGGGGLHSCGKFMHQVPGMLGLPSLRCLDFGEPHLNDVDAVYPQARARQIGLVRVQPAREELTDGTIGRRFPTGVTLLFAAGSLAEAQAVAAAYRKEGV